MVSAVDESGRGQEGRTHHTARALPLSEFHSQKHAQLIAAPCALPPPLVSEPKPSRSATERKDQGRGEEKTRAHEHEPRQASPLDGGQDARQRGPGAADEGGPARDGAQERREAALEEGREGQGREGRAARMSRAGASGGRSSGRGGRPKRAAHPSVKAKSNRKAMLAICWDQERCQGGPRRSDSREWHTDLDDERHRLGRQHLGHWSVERATKRRKRRKKKRERGARDGPSRTERAERLRKVRRSQTGGTARRGGRED